jgi:hypothetical protein
MPQGITLWYDMSVKGSSQGITLWYDMSVKGSSLKVDESLTIIQLQVRTAHLRFKYLNKTNNTPHRAVFFK